jgi:voltage-gated potassium channel
VHEAKVGMFQFAVLVLTLCVLAAFLADTLLGLPPAVGQVIHWVDTAVCVVLLVDFAIRFRRAESKLRFMKWGWIDLIASIPNLEVLRWGRLVRVLRIIRLLRAVRSLQRILALLFRNRVEGGAVSIGLTAFLLVAFSSASILICERDPNANIKTAEDAVWWSISTVTTVGYGDKYPVTTEGRLLGMVLMTAGVGLFGGLSGLAAAFFFGARESKSVEHQEILARLEQLQAKLDAMSSAQRSPGSER